MRRKWSWTSLQEERAAEVLKVTEDLRAYHPLTLRQIYYQLVSSGRIDNHKSSYVMLSKLVKWMRIDDRLPWNALEDRSRRMSGKKGFESIKEFIEHEVDGFLDGYTRCLVQGQDKYIEVWLEKDALMRLFMKTVYPYCIRTVVCKGYQSVTFIADFYKRAEQAIMKGQEPVVLYFGDLDPSGVQMLEATKETLEKEMDLYGVKFKRIALNPEHISLYNLPSDPDAAKTTDPRYKQYAAKYGTVAVELDALHPAALEAMIKEAIEAEVDMAKFESQMEQEKEDQLIMDSIRDDVVKVVEEKIDDWFTYAQFD
jgi:hypothetical protein